MGKKTKTPKAPDYTALANQQAKLAQDQQQQNIQASRPDQFGPSGSVTWEQDPTTGEWTQNTQFNPEEQAIYESQREGQGLLSGKANEMIAGLDTGQIDFSGAPEMPTVGGYDQRMIDTIRELQAPDLARRRGSQEARLAAMGLGTGSGNAWGEAQRSLGNAENDADLKAILAGIQQGNTAFGQGMQARQQGVGETMAQKQGNLQQILGLLGGAKGMSTPQFAGFSTPLRGDTVADVTGAAQKNYQSALDKANAENAANNQLWGTAASLAGTIGGSLIGAPWLGAAADSIFGGTPTTSANHPAADIGWG